MKGLLLLLLLLIHIPFIFNTQDSPPIDLISFTAIANIDYVELKWVTASEISSNYFILGKSSDGINFKSIDIIEGADTSIILKRYVVIDKNPINGDSYYRLKQIDYNGNYSYSNIEHVYYSGTNGVNVNVYPNPNNNGILIISINAKSGLKITIMVHDMNDNELYSKELLTEHKGNNLFILNLKDTITSGLYIITATSKENFYTKKLLIKN